MIPVFVVEEWELPCDQDDLMRCVCGSTLFSVVHEQRDYELSYTGNPDAGTEEITIEKNVHTDTYICRVCGRRHGGVDYYRDKRVSLKERDIFTFNPTLVLF